MFAYKYVFYVRGTFPPASFRRRRCAENVKTFGFVSRKFIRALFFEAQIVIQKWECVA